MRFPGNTEGSYHTVVGSGNKMAAEEQPKEVTDTMEAPETIASEPEVTEEITLAEIVKMIEDLKKKVEDIAEKQDEFSARMHQGDVTTPLGLRDATLTDGEEESLDEKILKWIHTGKVSTQLLAMLFTNLEIIADAAVKIFKNGKELDKDFFKNLPSKGDSQLDIISIINLLKQLGIIKSQEK